MDSDISKIAMLLRDVENCEYEFSLDSMKVLSPRLIAFHFNCVDPVIGLDRWAFSAYVWSGRDGYSCKDEGPSEYAGLADLVKEKRAVFDRIAKRRVL